MSDFGPIIRHSYNCPIICSSLNDELYLYTFKNDEFLLKINN